MKYMAGLGVLAIALSVVTWAMDLTGLVLECAYCRVQRTVIGFLGLLMLLPARGDWFVVYVASVIGAYGAMNAVHMNFVGATGPLMVGKFTPEAGFQLDTFIFSGAALFIIVGQVWLLVLARRAHVETKAVAGEHEPPDLYREA
ncbi:MAG: hypothetical protein AAGC95_04960 [Pseudomonadota bacterium]